MNKNNFVEGMLKGRMAETLVEELLKASGNVVYRFGYEAIVQNLVQLEKSFDRYSDIGERIRAIPDFIVIDKSGKPEFVEVKFRWNAEIKRDDIPRLQKIFYFWNAKFILVNCWRKPYFQVSYPPYFDRNRHFASRSLIEEKNWKIDKSAYAESEELVYRYLTPTLIPKNK